MKRSTVGLWVVLAALVCGCSQSAPDADGGLDAAVDAPRADGPPADGPAPGDVGPPSDARDAGDAAGDAPPVGDGPLADSATDGAPDGGSGKTYRNSLSVCWTTPGCKRVLAIAHGGNWDVTNVPYLSNGAIAAAYASGFDGVKIDVRVTSDNVPVLAHSSPIKFYESLDCVNKRIEQMTAAQVTACHRFPSGTETFQRFDDVLNYLRGKMVAQLTVKESTDYARVIAAVIAAGAEDFAFFEISTNDLRTKIPTISGAQNVWYLINVASNVTEVDELLNTINNPRAFMYEFDPGISLSPTIGPKLTTAGIKAFVYDSNVAASVAGLQGYYNQGFDVVSSQAGNNGVTARQQVNTTRGINPP